jgi:DNA-binding transcriptional LysR family regulator
MLYGGLEVGDVPRANVDRLQAIRIFVEVARGKSFAAAAQRLGVSRGSVTKQILALETQLGARLLNRSTQHVALTEAGTTLLERGSALLKEFEAIEQEIGGRTLEARGIIRVGVPSYYGTSHLVPAILEFQRENPDVNVTLYLDMGNQNLIKEGIDLSIRIATSLKDTSEISRFLIRAPQVLVASRAYLDAFGQPNSLDDLRNHNCLVHTIKSPADIWHFRSHGEPLSLAVNGTLKANFGEALKAAALLGKGISMHPTYMVEKELKSGELEIVLPDIEVIGVELYAIYLHKENLPLRIRSFVDFLKKYVAGDPKYRAPLEWLSQDDPRDV